MNNLPAHSPNRNLIERLYTFLQKEALPKSHSTFVDWQHLVTDVLDHLERDEEIWLTRMTERFRLRPRIETVVVGVGQGA